MNKQALKEELVDLRIKLTESESQALKIADHLQLETYHWGLVRKARWDIREANAKLCELAKLLGLNKLDLVKPERVNK